MSRTGFLSGKSFGFIADPFEGLNREKDSTLALMQTALEAGARCFFCLAGDIFVREGVVYGAFYSVLPGPEKAAGLETLELRALDAVFMRRDPPIDAAYYECAQLLSLAQEQGARVYNDPTALRDYGEKTFALLFPDLIPPTLISARKDEIRSFAEKHGRIILKPLNASAGRGVFFLQAGDVNLDVIWETQTDRGKTMVVVQEFQPAIKQGDVRAVIYNGRVYDHVLVRTPQEGTVRGNMAAGGSISVRAIAPSERQIAERVARILKEKGIVLAGIDIIGNRLIEINHTSPTGMRDIGRGIGRDVVAEFWNALYA